MAAPADPPTERLEGLVRDAMFCENNTGRFRMILKRSWGLHQRTAVVIGLNPSTADATTDDPTIKALYQHCAHWDRDRLLMVNLFSFCATEPTDMRKAPDPEGPLNFDTLEEIFTAPHRDRNQLVVAAWGKHGTFRDQDKAMMRWLDYWGVKTMCLGTNKDDTPRHPLYVKRGTPLVPFGPQTRRAQPL